ncbi:hypothetical protein GCK72_021731 [Caenorhabditis remanei]|uniref:F-box domain-containing protein n=1 Tax=Caenorhabditis remanei TaxID=31234 RepID=A0A6A5GKX1_CAERE|nr:hypothetical protein GCK72_021731 [Caenorhabditis remanei]KAF1755162.1 hypothetical protein GCK72_021731 [Caenorhabditis remanei]
MTLTDLPIGFFDQLLEYSGFREIFCLRKVCRGLRDYIDTTKPDLKLTQLFITLREEKLYLTLQFRDEQVVVEYRNGYGSNLFDFHCVVSDGEVVKTLKGERCMDVFFGDFRLQKTKLKSLKLSQEAKYNEILFEEQTSRNLIERLEECFKARSCRLQTTEINLQTFSILQVLSILPYLEPENLKIIELMLPTVPYNKDTGSRTWRTEKLEELEQWQVAESLMISKDICIGSIINFLHFTHVCVTFYSISGRDLLTIKNILLDDDRVHEFFFKYKHLYHGEQFFESLGRPYIEEQNPRNLWYFRFPESEQILRVCHWSASLMMSFHRKDVESVPVNAVIQE